MRLLIRVLLLTCTCWMSPAFALCEQPLRVNVGDWQPYTYLLPNGDADGIDVAVVKQTAVALNCRIRFTHVPPERAHALMESGEIDILLAASDVPERHRYAWFSVAYRDEVIALFASKSDRRTPPSFAALLAGPWHLLAPRFGWYGKDYEQIRSSLQQAGRVQPYDDYVQGVSMLSAKRADLLLGDAAALQWAAKTQHHALRQLFVANRSPVYLMLSKRTFTAADVARFNRSLSASASNAATDGKH